MARPSSTQSQKGLQLPAPTGSPFARGYVLLAMCVCVCVPRRMRNEDIKHIVKQQIKMSFLHNSDLLCESIVL